MRYEKPKQLKVNLQMSMASASGGGDYWRIEVCDAASRVTLFELRLTPEQLGCALATRQQSAVPCTLYDTSRAGLEMEVRREEVPIPESALAYTNNAFEAWYEQQREVFAAQGWRLDDDRGFNGHRHRGGKYSLTMRRWVAPEGDPAGER